MIAFRIDVHHHIHSIPSGTLETILERLDRIVTTQTELSQQITDLTAQNEKARAEVLAKIADMQAALDAAGSVDPTVLEAFAALKASVQADDDIVPDA